MGTGELSERSPFIRLHQIGREHGTDCLFAKLEYTTPTGNHKYRFAETALAHYHSSLWAGISVASCGHLASSVAYLCAQQHIRCQVFVPRGCPIPIITSHHVTIDSSAASYEEAVYASKRYAAVHSMLDATPGAHLASAYRDGAALITEEILRQSELLPEVIMCPVGNGTTLAGIHSGFMRKVKFIPAHFGVTTVGNTLTGAGVGPYPFDWDVEPLRSTEPLDADVAREAVRQSGGGFLCVSLEEIRNATDRLRIHEGLSVHPAAAAVLAGWNALIERDGGFARKPTVLILTAQR